MRLPLNFLIAIPMLAATFVPVQAAETESLIVAGGCFWCVESDFDHIEGVTATTSGYTGGDMENPTYRNHGQHLEGVKIDFDPDVVSLEDLLVAYWHSVDPTDPGGQFCDRGHSYTTAVFVTPEQREAAEASKAAAQQELGDKKIVTPILDAKAFWDAEDYHQDYYKKNPARYNFYRFSCGRNARVDAIWGPNSYKGINH
jgi:peptide-methionine (S)-S-oxide reductase